MSGERTKTILLVEDQQVLREVVQQHLKDSKFQLIEAEDGLKALEIIAKTKVDLIISDIQMPRMSGIELLKSLRKVKADAPPFVFTTAFSDISSVEALAMGAEAFLKKPLARKDLLDVVNRALIPRDERWQNFTIEAGSARRFDTTLNGDYWALLNDSKEVLEIGQGGLFYPLDSDFPSAFEILSFKFESGVPELGIIEGLGQVRWVRQEADPSFQMGFGLEFLLFDETTRQRLLVYLEDAAPRSYIPIGRHA